MRRAVDLLVLLILVLLPGWVSAQGPNHVGLVVRFADGEVVTRCLAFAERDITGEEVLRRSGLSAVLDHSYGQGAAVCKIEKDGCDLAQGQECFCKCQGRDCQYWAYFDGKADGGWSYLGVGATGHAVRDGSLEGWAWTKGTLEQAGVTPPNTTFAEVCAAALATGTTPTQATASALTGTPEPAATIVPEIQASGTMLTRGSQSVVPFVALVAVLGVAGAVVLWRRRGGG